MAAGFPWVGEACALAAALCWSSALVLFKRCGETVGPLPLNLFKNVVGILLLLATLPFIINTTDQPWSPNRDDVYLLILSGVLGVALADTLLLYGLNMIGVGLLTIVECAYTPSVVFIAWAYLGERVEAHHYVGGAMILAAVFLCTTHRTPTARTRWQIMIGVFLSATSVVLMAFGIVVVKPIIEQSPLIEVSLVRLVGGTAILAMILGASPQRKEHFAVFKPSANWKFYVPASILATYLALIFWVAGFMYAKAAVAAVLNQTSTIMATILATVVLKEPFTTRKLASVVLALGGVVVITYWSALSGEGG